MSCALVLALAPGAGRSQEDAVAAINAARAQGCEGRAGVQAPLRGNARLGEVGRGLAERLAIADALRRAGYHATSANWVQVSGARDQNALAQWLRARHCNTLLDREPAEVGLYRRADQVWLVFAAPRTLPSAADASRIAARVRDLVNQARSAGARCGGRPLPAAGPLRPHAVLERVARDYADHLLAHGHFSHVGRDGTSPGDRVTRMGYRWRAVGENIAAGQPAPEAVFRSWLDSPTHCAAMMDGRFTEMGVAYATDSADERGVYWVLVLAAPR